MARKTTESEEFVAKNPMPVPPVVKREPFLTPPMATIIAAIILAFAILLHGGIIKIKGVTPKVGTTTTTTTGTTPSITETEPSAVGGPALSEKLVALAEEIGLDREKFKSCVDGRKFKDEFDKDNADASTSGVNGTPGFVVGRSAAGSIQGVKISGAYPFDTFKGVFDALAANTPIDQIISTRAADSLETATANLDDDPVLGNPNAPVTLVEFSDYECPFCQRHFKQVYPSIKKDYIDTGKVKLVFRDYVAVPGHNPAAEEEALAVSCARDQGGDEAYYKMHDEVFSRTRANGQGI